MKVASRFPAGPGVEIAFLGEGEKYQCTLFKDGVNASRQAEDYVKETFVVDAHTKLPIHLASGGGFALKLERTFVTEVKPSAVPAGKGIPSFYKKPLRIDLRGEKSRVPLLFFKISLF